jgi:N-acetylglucosaminyldiphosphoundecaprenol N-acetyl-beta-D-mannosaminyltransferase
LNVVGNFSPPFKSLLEMDHAEIKARVRAARPDLLFVSFGCPKQEKWIAMHYQALGVPVTIGTGATIDFLAGRVKRAPLWMQRSGLEWIFRLIQEPRRLYRRYSKDIWVFGLRIAGQLWDFRSGARLSSAATSFADAVPLPRIFDRKAVGIVAAEFDALAGRAADCFLNLSHVEFIDSTGIAALMRLHHQLASRSRRLILIAPSAAMKRALSFMRLEMFFDCADNLTDARRILATRAHESEHLVEINRRGAFRALVWYGEITAINTDDVWERTSAYIEQAAHVRDFGEPQALVIDLSVVRFIDSSGLGLMVRVRKLARQYGLKLRYTNLQPAVLNVIQIARLEDFLMGREAEKPAVPRPQPAAVLEIMGK